MDLDYWHITRYEVDLDLNMSWKVENICVYFVVKPQHLNLHNVNPL